ncbi:PREDICTED: uncharacterized protein C9orf85 homolog [Dufourea novaeangliae]|uniref:uncharacterized protein C9orf85 homolog n=1 Tax=Dufourea novaeangliae TaxID=178035 RepID=UPI0007676675|nr:PREDICTED: uncharacterized protein C9orf85 homolog [Dufourea novaeangliae]
MSTQKGNSNRSRPQKYKNQTTFKNDLHDKSLKTKIINSIEVVDVCCRCKQIIEWKIKYKKYKPLKIPSKCIRCEQKSVKHAYHNICLPCAKENKICSKCGIKNDIVEGKPSKEESVKLDAELQNLLKEIPERKRRTLIRYINHNAASQKNNSGKNKNQGKEYEDEKNIEEEDILIAERTYKDDLLFKLRSLVIKKNYEDGCDNGDLDSD